MTKKTRQSVTILVLCVLLVASGIGYYMLIQHQTKAEKKKEKTEQQEISVYDISAKDIQKISFKNSKNKMTLIKENGKWMVQGEKAFPLDDTRIDDMLTTIAGVKADSVVTDQCEDLSEYQLDQPDLSLQVEGKDGQSLDIQVGMESISGGGRYMCCNDQSKIYMIPTSLYTSFDYTKNQLMDEENFPTVKADYIEHLEMKGKNNFELSYNEANSPYKDLTNWVIKKPYSQQVPGDVSEISTLFENICALDFDECATYKTNASELKKYGLDQPQETVSLTYYITKKSKKKSNKTDKSEDASKSKKQKVTVKKIYKKLELMIGKKTKDESGYYVMLQNGNRIYTMKKDKLDDIIGIKSIDYVNPTLCNAPISDLKSMKLTYQGKTYTYELKAQKNSDSKEANTYSVSCNGKETDYDTFSSAYAAITNLEANGDIDKNVKVKGEKPVAVLNIRLKDKNLSITFYPYDGNNFYRIDVNGMMQFVVDMRNVDTNLAKLLPKKK